MHSKGLQIPSAWFSLATQAQERLFHRENGVDASADASASASAKIKIFPFPDCVYACVRLRCEKTKHNISMRKFATSLHSFQNPAPEHFNKMAEAMVDS